MGANFSTLAAVERVPQIKPEDVEEVFFGNVLSAKYGPPSSSIPRIDT
jgi:acetyl-CoA acetyltransferase